MLVELLHFAVFKLLSSKCKSLTASLGVYRIELTPVVGFWVLMLFGLRAWHSMYTLYSSRTILCSN